LRAVDANPPEDEAGLLWETVLGEHGEPQGRLLQQLVVVDEDGRRHAVPFNIEWPSAVLQEALRHRGISGVQLKEIYLDPEHLERVRPVLSEVFPQFRDVQHFGRSGAGQQRRTLIFENQIGPTYLRAIAKIAFHAALRFVPGLSGQEWEVDVIRRFIRRGDLPMINPVQMTSRPIIAGIGDGLTLRDWGHVVAVETTHAAIHTKLQFFIGPGAVPPTWMVRVGRRPDSVSSDVAVAYYARYLDDPSPDGHTGEMIPLEAGRV
jgi:hypothetical protein